MSWSATAKATAAPASNVNSRHFISTLCTLDAEWFRRRPDNHLIYFTWFSARAGGETSALWLWIDGRGPSDAENAYVDVTAPQVLLTYYVHKWSLNAEKPC